MTTIIAPEIVPPFWSTTAPVIAPVAPACARRPAGKRIAIDNTPRKTTIHFFILPIPLFVICSEPHPHLLENLRKALRRHPDNVTNESSESFRESLYSFVSYNQRNTTVKYMG